MRYLGDDNDPQPGEDVGDPAAGPDPGSITVWPEELFDIGPAGGAVANLFTYGPIVLSAAEVTALTLLWRRSSTPKTWAWYVLAGFVGLRAFGAVMSIVGSGSTTGVATSVGGWR